MVFDCSNRASFFVSTMEYLQDVLSAVLPKFQLMPSTKILFLILEGANGKTASGT